MHLISQKHWYCTFCNGKIFAFNHFDDDTDFINAVSDSWFINNLYTLSDLDQRIFSPYELDEEHIDFPNIDLDPDANYFNDLNVCSTSSTYISEDNFKSFINTTDASVSLGLSFIHLNIRSVPKNIDKLVLYLHFLNFSFNFIALTETWFTEASRDLYDLDNYNHKSFYRTNRRGGGVSLFIKDSISYTRP
jgi:hypothetical protein